MPDAVGAARKPVGVAAVRSADVRSASNRRPVERRRGLRWVQGHSIDQRWVPGKSRPHAAIGCSSLSAAIFPTIKLVRTCPSGGAQAQHSSVEVPAQTLPALTSERSASESSTSLELQSASIGCIFRCSIRTGVAKRKIGTAEKATCRAHQRRLERASKCTLGAKSTTLWS
jgi:hypothetical protein